MKERTLDICPYEKKSHYRKHEYNVFSIDVVVEGDLLPFRPYSAQALAGSPTAIRLSAVKWQAIVDNAGIRTQCVEPNARGYALFPLLLSLKSSVHLELASTGITFWAGYALECDSFLNCGLNEQLGLLLIQSMPLKTFSLSSSETIVENRFSGNVDLHMLYVRCNRNNNGKKCVLCGERHRSEKSKGEDTASKRD